MCCLQKLYIRFYVGTRVATMFEILVSFVWVNSCFLCESPKSEPSLPAAKGLITRTIVISFSWHSKRQNHGFTPILILNSLTSPMAFPRIAGIATPKISLLLWANKSHDHMYGVTTNRVLSMHGCTPAPVPSSNLCK